MCNRECNKILCFIYRILTSESHETWWLKGTFHRLHWSLSTEIVKAAIMALLMSGKCISKLCVFIIWICLSRLYLLSFKCFELISWFLPIFFLLFFFFGILKSTLNGCYGIPWVHYKGRQGDFYILVRFDLELLIIRNSELVVSDGH